MLSPTPLQLMQEAHHSTLTPRAASAGLTPWTLAATSCKKQRCSSRMLACSALTTWDAVTYLWRSSIWLQGRTRQNSQSWLEKIGHDPASKLVHGTCWDLPG